MQLSIVDQPENISASEGEEAMFSVTAAGGEKPYRYQWQRMTGVDQWTDIPGADKYAYSIESVQLEQNGLTVRCVITDQLGNSVTSDSAVLSVQAKATADNGANTPQTGDTTSMVSWIALMLLCGAGITGVTVYTRRKRRDE